MKNRFLPAALIAQAVWLPIVNAQDDQWPPLPQLVIKEGTTWKNNDLLKKDGTSYYDFTEKLSTFLPPSRLYHPPSLKDYEGQMGGQAFELLSSQDAPRLFVLTPGRANQKGKAYGIFNLKKVEKSSKNASEIFYIAEDTIALFHSPLFSPDGQKVIIRDGYPPDDRYNGNNLFLWELASGKLHYILHGASDIPGDVARGNDSIMLPFLSWSPGSRYLSYMRGGNTFGDYDIRGDGYELYCMDSSSRLDHQVMKDAGLHWSWTYHGQILCSLVKPENQGDLAQRNGRPSVYAVDAQGGQPQKLFDGGYYAQESPDGKWIAFCDWPGELFDASNPSPQTKNLKQKGLFLFHKPTKKRVFVGALALEEAGWPADAPLLQWSPDGSTLYVLDATRNQGRVTGTIYRMSIDQQQLHQLARIELTPSGGYGFFRARGISPDGKTLYYEAREGVQGPPGVASQRFTLLGVNTQSGAQTPLARLMNIANENPDWDFRDGAGQSPALVGAETLENALPAAIERKTSAPKRAPNSK